jgi:DNA-binding beta-propeller fold protein YncE
MAGLASEAGASEATSQFEMADPEGLAVDQEGNVFIAATDTNCVYKLGPTGLLTRVAGTARFGHSGDGGPATKADLAQPNSVAVDGKGSGAALGGTRNAGKALDRTEKAE